MSYKGFKQEQLERLCKSYRLYTPACVRPLNLPYTRCVETPRILDEARNPGTRIDVSETVFSPACFPALPPAGWERNFGDYTAYGTYNDPLVCVPTDVYYDWWQWGTSTNVTPNPPNYMTINSGNNSYWFTKFLQQPRFHNPIIGNTVPQNYGEFRHGYSWKWTFRFKQGPRHASIASHRHNDNKISIGNLIYSDTPVFDPGTPWGVWDQLGYPPAGIQRDATLFPDPYSMCWNIAFDVTIYGDDMPGFYGIPSYWQRKMAVVVDGVSGGSAPSTWYKRLHVYPNYEHAQLYPTSANWEDGIFLEDETFLVEVYCWQEKSDMSAPARLRVVATRESDSAQEDTGVLAFPGYTQWVNDIYLSVNAYGAGPNEFYCYLLKQEIIPT